MIDFITINNYASGNLYCLKMGKLIFIVAENLRFSDQIDGFKEYKIEGFPKSINNTTINSSCISGNVRYGEIFITGSILQIRTFTTQGIYGTISYLTE